MRTCVHQNLISLKLSEVLTVFNYFKTGSMHGHESKDVKPGVEVVPCLSPGPRSDFS